MTVNATSTSKRTWGLSPQEWSSAAERLRDAIAEVARERSTITYGEAARRAFDGRFSARSGALMDLLAQVDAEEEAARGVIVATLVVRADTGMPGEGYFAFAQRELGRDIGHDAGDRATFWQAEAKRVWDAYADQSDMVKP